MKRTITAVAAVVLVAGVLGGCREEEQGRPLILEKGSYAGPADTTLTKAQLNELTDRAALQGRAVSSGGSAFAPAEEGAGEVKEKVPATVQEKVAPLPEAELNARAKRQSGQ